MSPSGKVIGIGFHKTGTSTLGKALERLGYEVCGVQWELADPLIQGNMEPVWDIADRYQAFQDNPWPLLFREMDARYPGSLFILTWRDEERWIRSVTDHLGKNSTRMREWIYDGKGAPLGNESHYLERYERHDREVKEYFKERPGDLLLMNFEEGDGWEKLCHALGCPIPDEAFPHENEGTHGVRDRLARKVRNRLHWLRRKARKG
ncbi:MAG: sulfotransferase family protein [Flavobacteriales bacterium]